MIDEDDQRGLMARWGALVVLSLTMFIVVLDTSMMSVAVPQITKDLEIAPLGLSVTPWLLALGVVLLPLSAAVLLVSLVTPNWSRWIHAKYLIIAGAATMVVGVAGMIAVTEPGMGKWDLTVPLLIFGAGTGLLLAQVPNLTMSAVDASASDAAAGVQNSVKELGTTL